MLLYSFLRANVFQSQGQDFGFLFACFTCESDTDTLPFERLHPPQRLRRSGEHDPEDWIITKVTVGQLWSSVFATANFSLLPKGSHGHRWNGLPRELLSCSTVQCFYACYRRVIT